jgi:hypothetical protein
MPDTKRKGKEEFLWDGERFKKTNNWNTDTIPFDDRLWHDERFWDDRYIWSE